MKIKDHIRQAGVNLKTKKLRTFLTILGVVISVGALVCMIAFGEGAQENVTENFKGMGLLNYITVLPGSGSHHDKQASEEATEDANEQPGKLNDETIDKIMELGGVEAAFPAIRFPAQIHLEDEEEFIFVQVLPANICKTKLVKLTAGKPYESDDEKSIIVSSPLVRRLDVDDAKSLVGREIQLSTLSSGLDLFSISNIAGLMLGKGLPVSKETYTFTVAGVAEPIGLGGFMPITSDVFIATGVSRTMKTLELTSIWIYFEHRSWERATRQLVLRCPVSGTLQLSEIRSKSGASRFFR